MKKLRLGMLGTGLAADRLYLPAFKALKDRIEIVACCNRTRSKAEAFAKKVACPLVVDKAEQLFALATVDAVLISLPIEMQPRYVLKALAAGKAVISEKPMGPSYKAGVALLKAAKRFKKPWLVAENFAFMQHIEQAEAWLLAGKLGDVRLVEVAQISMLGGPTLMESWRTAPKFKGGFVMDGGVHVAHAVRRLMGSPSTVRGLTAQFDPGLPPMDTAVAALRFQSGAVGVWRSCFSAHYEGPLIKLYGSKANLEMAWDTCALVDPQGRRLEFRPSKDSFTLQFGHFADVMLRNTRLKFQPEEALADLKFIDRIISAR